MKFIFRCSPLFLLLALFALAGPAGAKGRVDQITIHSPGLAEPVAITDEDILSRFDPWGGQFIGTGGPLTYPPNVGLRLPYQVFFYVQNNRGELVLRYMFYYYPDPTGGRGTIYLPGAGEPYYRVNVGTIIRGESDGRWHYAMPTWDATVRGYLQSGSGTSNGGLGAVSPIFWFAAGFGIVVLGGLLLWVRHRRKLSLMPEPPI